MLKYLIFLFVCIYLHCIFSNLFKIVEISSYLKALADYLNSADFSNGRLVVQDNYHSTLETLLFLYPRICHYLDFGCPVLAYGKADNVNYSSASKIYNELRMQRNLFFSYFFHSLNPLCAFFKLLRLPSFLFKSLGFSLSGKNFKFVNLLGWIAAYFLNMYSSEIKHFVNSLFH